ncbi:MAG: hypothetical protein ACP5MW_07055, partial [Thermoplasmata archaeon]
YYTHSSYAGLTYINITSANGLKWKNITTSNGTFYIPVSIIAPKNVSAWIYFNFTVNSGYAYYIHEHILLEILPATFILNLTGIPAAIPLGSRQDFYALTYNPVGDYIPAVNYTIIEKPSLGDMIISESRGELSVNFIATSMGSVIIQIAAYTTNGTAIYRNSTITIYNNTNTT